MEWINIEERQPKIGQLVVVLGAIDTEYTYNDNEIGFVYYEGYRCELKDSILGTTYIDISHWQEINTEIPKI